MNKSFRIGSTVLACAYFWYCAKNYTEWHFIDNANLIFHEAGHTIFFFLGTFIQVLAGSGLQVMLPLSIALYFFYHRQNISGALCLLWTGQSLLSVSVYAGDAVLQQLDLLGGDSVMHDWNYLLSTTGLLPHTDIVASGIYFLGICTIGIGSILSLYYASSIDPEKNM
ncbi:MAG: hypothetical protein NTV02_02070 [Candidatus Zambryskibacteria bacterium]|nr:hypothetical protein [Candidatus Zambryskibacteria bacterium]